MSQANRQSELLAGNDWLAAYRAFTEVNLNASDFYTIRESMVEYIRRNYSEDFNDWIESSEFVAIIDLLAWMGQNLAFRTDINARENFLEIARRRESILRLARSLSYNARRNYPARGLVKLTEISTTQDVYDSLGRNLNGAAVRWNDPNNSEWFEQWILVLNSSLVETNPFGRPLKAESLDGVETQLYRLDSVPGSASSLPFSAQSDDQSLSFNVVNPDFNQTHGLVEQAPDDNGAFHLIYRSDGNGNSSPDTGFFLYFKQGNLEKQDFRITDALENRMIFLDTQDVNETDVWVQSVDDLGTLLPDGRWTRVAHVPTDDVSKVLLTAENVTYNDIDPQVQNLFQVITQEDDRIAVRFGDGRFGRSPTGNLRVWYRVSSRRQVNLRPEDLQGISVAVQYYARNNTQRRLNMTFSLQESVSSVPSEPSGDIKRRAGKVYGTQGRMVSASDYNELPAQTNLAVKLKAVNRVYSGQSRFIDLNDPTGNYQSTQVFADDGAIYQDLRNEVLELSRSRFTDQQIMTGQLADLADSGALRDFFTDHLYQNLESDQIQLTNRYVGDYLSGGTMRQEVLENLNLRRTFALGFDNRANRGWYVLQSSEVTGDLSRPYAVDEPTGRGKDSWLIHCQYSGDFWRITSRSLGYVFESQRECRFFFVNEFKTIDPLTGRAGSDAIKILRNANGFSGLRLKSGADLVSPPSTDLVLDLSSAYVHSDGYQDPTKVRVRPSDLDGNGLADVPYAFKLLQNLDPGRRLVVHRSSLDLSGYPVEELVTRLEYDQISNRFNTRLAANQYGFHEKLVGGLRTLDIYLGDPQGSVPEVGGAARLATDVAAPSRHTVVNAAGQKFIIRPGVTNLVFQWKHYAPSNHRIDPAVSNIIDMFVLTRDYNDRMVSWRNGGAEPLTQPKPPSELSLRTTFSDLESYKMFSDEMIWRPVKFKLLFGQSADPAYRAKFKVVRLLGSGLSDGEIKSRVIEIMADFFDVNNWDFGEKFFFSELAAYIHRQLSTAISSIEIVPVLDESYFGSLREIHCAPDELFFSTAQVGDVDIITANTPSNLRIR